MQGVAPLPPVARLRAALPRGRTLPADAWYRRHRVLLGLLWAHAPALTFFALARGYSLEHSLQEGLIVAAIASLATAAGRRQRVAAALVSLGLITCSAILVHLWGGVIEAHFHFFVMIVVLSLYEDWLPFLLAAAYVLVHHGVTGALDPGSVYNHRDAIAHPWKWASIHALFVTGAGIGAVAAWRMNEQLRAETTQSYERARESEERYRAARDQALEATRMKSEFLAKMSHEIRTPMNGVIGMTELLLDAEPTSEQRQYLETLRTSGDALLCVVDDILDFSKLEAGKVELEVSEFHLHEAIEEACELFTSRGHAKRIELLVSVDEEVPALVQGDGTRVRQVLINLISNAVKFTQDGEVVVGARLVEQDRERVLVRLEVSDTGIGMEPSQVDHVFEAFSQADTSTTRRYGGTGLGLAICKELVELMGGQIGATSSPGEGSTFWFTVSLAQVPDEAERGPVVVDPKIAGARVLLVGGVEASRAILTRQLAAWGMGVSFAGDGRRALSLLRTAAGRGELHDVVLVDIGVGGMGAVDLAAAIHAEPELRPAHVLVLTSDPASVRRQPGIFKVLQKPVRASRLYNAIVAALVRSEDEVEAPVMAAAADTAPSEAETGPGPTILVAEDNPVNQLVAVRMLEHRGYRPEVVSSGRQAVSALESNDYDLVLMDCQMPELDGYQATAEIREKEGAARHTPIVAMTAHAMKEDRQRCLAAGMDDYLSKPLRPEALEAVLARHLGSASEPAAEIPDPEEVPGNGAVNGFVDRARVEHLKAELGDRELVENLFEVFGAQTPSVLEDLRETAERGDGAGLRAAAHKLRGSCTSVGARSMSDLCQQLEAIADEGDTTRAAHLVAELDAAFPATRSELRAALSG